MYTEKEYITNLNKEISSIGQFTREDVYNLFKEYVTNEDRLRKAIDFWALYYDYVKYKSLFEFHRQGGLRYRSAGGFAVLPPQRIAGPAYERHSGIPDDGILSKEIYRKIDFLGDTTS